MSHPCPTCRWSPEEVTGADLRGTLRSLSGRWRWTVEGLSDAELATPAEINGPSLLDLGADLLRLFGHPAEDVVRGAELEAALAALSADAAADPSGRFDAPGLQARAHEASHLLSEAGRLVQASGRRTPMATGAVAGVHAGSGGVPKLPVDGATIGLRGLSGDRQKERRHHGRLWQAVSLWSVEVMDRLREEGHQVHPGACGENLALAGIDWSTIRVGVRLRIGPDALMEVTSWAAPCRKIAHCFVDGAFGRIEHDRHPGWARSYAAVLRDGEVRPGDEAVLEPADEQDAAPSPAIGRRAC
jgi:MOSC domain-containing protein YiiM